MCVCDNYKENIFWKVGGKEPEKNGKETRGREGGKKRKGRNEPKTLFPLNKLLRWSLMPETLKSTFILVICNISLFCIVEYSKSVVTMHFVSPANKKIFLANYGCCDKREGGG